MDKPVESYTSEEYNQVVEQPCCATCGKRLGKPGMSLGHYRVFYFSHMAMKFFCDVCWEQWHTDRLNRLPIY